MSLTWTPAEAASFRDGYLDWSALLAVRRRAAMAQQAACATEWEPVFVRLCPGDPAGTRGRLLAAIDDPDEPLTMDPHERAMLEERLADPQSLAGLADEYALYRRAGVADADHAALFEVLDTGVPVRVDDDADGARAPAPIGIARSPHPGSPIVAAIDDGIGFLNARFRRPGCMSTRFHALWVQALETRGQGKTVMAGRVLDAATIDAMLARNAEGDCYAALNASLFRGEGRHATGFGQSHGTQVLDLAAGADPDGTDPARHWPLLAVQLPPEAVEDTAGIRMESYMVQGMRWILHQARKLDPTAPVIVNISMGILAGPKTGTRFAEYQIAREAALWEQATGQPVRVVWAFGNNREGRLVAACALAPTQTGKAERALAWRVQPGDQTASYVEIHAHGGPLGSLEIALTAPDGSGSGFAPIEAGACRSALDRAGRPVARLYHVAARDFGGGRVCPAHYLLALAPTEARHRGEALVPAGGWTVGLRQSGQQATTVTVQVQRDDSLRGTRTEARQSRLDDAATADWDPETQDWTALGPGPITYAGTQNALATADEPQVLSVGAARRVGPAGATDPAAFRPTAYSGEGAVWSVPGPRVSAVVDADPFHPGLACTGTLSGSSARLGGTSAAAARISRALALSPLAVGQADGGLGGAALALIATAPADRARLGTHVVEILDTAPAVA